MRVVRYLKPHHFFNEYFGFIFAATNRQEDLRDNVAIGIF